MRYLVHNIEAMKKNPRLTSAHSAIKELRDRIESVVGEPVTFGSAADLPPEIERKFLESVLAFESAQEEPLIQHLRRRGFDPPSPSAVPPAEITPTLWKLIEAMAGLGIFLHHVDHLSDADLYEYLWREQLQEPIAIIEDDPGAWHIDPTLSGSEESMRVWLTYYADDADRLNWTRDFPGEPLPERQPLPFQRDQLLPRADPGPNQE